MLDLVGNCYVEGDKVVKFDDAFQEKVVIPEGITTIGKCAFEKYYGLVEIELPHTLKKIERNAFTGCSNLRRIHLPPGVTEIERGLFSGTFSKCLQLVEADFSEAAITVLEYGTFSGCKKLRTVKLPSTLERIEFNAFEDCISLSSLSMQEGLKIIETDFHENRGLKTLNLPDSVIHIRDMTMNVHVRNIIISQKQLDRFREYLPPNCKIQLKP